MAVTDTRARTINETERQFTSYVSGDSNAIHPNLRTAVFRTSIQNGGVAEYKAVQNEFVKTTSVDGKEICLVSMGQVPTPDLAKDFLGFQFSDKVAVQDVHFGSASLATNAKARKALWDYVQSDWDKISEKLSARPIIMDRFIKTGLSKFASHDIGKNISDFFSKKDTEGWNRAVVQVIDTVRANAKYKERDEASVLEWLQAHSYL